MADRTVSYVFKGNFTNLGAGLTTMGKGVGDLGVKLTALDRQGETARRGLTTLGSTAGKIGLVAAAGLGVVVLAAANFEQAMSNVAATGDDARNSLDGLRAAAIKAGADTKFSAGEAAAGIEALLKAGVTAKDVMAGGLSGALDLAAAGELGVADAAEIAATAMTQFKLSGEDVPHIADLLAAGAGKAQGEVTDMAAALNQSGLVAAQMGVSIEETTGVLAEFASAGLLGSDAGTSLKTMLLRLANPSAESAKAMAALGIAAYDTQGNFVGLESLAGQLQTAFEGKTQAERDSALATIFGSDAIRAASVLYQGGAQSVADWTGKVDDAGFAAEVAAIKMDNLKGDLEQLKGSLETALIGAGGGSQGPLRSLVQNLTDAVNTFNKLPPSIQSSTTSLLGLVAVTSGSLWFGSVVIGRIAATKLALTQLGASATRTSAIMKGLGTGAGVLVGLFALGAAIHALEDGFDDALPKTEALTKALLDLGDAETARQLTKDIGDLGVAVDQLDAEGLQGFADGIAQIANSGGIKGNLFTGFAAVTGGQGALVRADELQQYADSVAAVDAALANIATTGSPQQAKAAFDSLAAAQGLSKDQQSALLDLMPDYQAALDGSANAATLATGATTGLTSATTGLVSATESSANAAEEEAKAIQDAIDAMREKRDAALSGFDAETRWREAVKEATKAARNNSAGIKGSSKAALANRDTLSSLAQAWNNQSDAVKNTKGRFEDARQTFIDTATAMGVPKKAAQELARQYLEIPPKVTTKVVVDTKEALAKVSALKGRMEHLDTTATATVVTKHVDGGGGGGGAAGGGTEPEGSGRVSSRGGLGRLSPASARGLSAQAEQEQLNALKGLTYETDRAKGATKGLKERLHDAEERLAKLSRSADNAHKALDTLKSDRDDLKASASGALARDLFSGSLAEFDTASAAQTADAQAMLAALKTLVTNGLDPHSDLFKQLAASGNVALVQQFAALTKDQLAGEAAKFAAGQKDLTAVGSFAGQSAFGDLIKAQSKVTNHLDNAVHDLAQTVKHLEKAVKDMPGKVKQGAKDGSKEGSAEGTREGYGNDAKNARRRAVRA